jgi:hypothetical protein
MYQQWLGMACSFSADTLFALAWQGGHVHHSHDVVEVVVTFRWVD